MIITITDQTFPVRVILVLMNTSNSLWGIRTTWEACKYVYRRFWGFFIRQRDASPVAHLCLKIYLSLVVHQCLDNVFMSSKWSDMQGGVTFLSTYSIQLVCKTNLVLTKMQTQEIGTGFWAEIVFGKMQHTW